VILTGLACGTLLAAVGLALWDGFRQVPGLSYAVQVIGWLAGALLLIGALLAWQGDQSLSTPALRLILMAALAAPPGMGVHRRRPSPWSNEMLILPALILAGAGLFWPLEPVGNGVSRPPVAPMELAVLVCGGLGARVLGEALSEMAAQTRHSERLTAATYALLTLLVGGAALVNLWQRGSVWGGSASEGGLAGVWLAWSAARLGPRQRSRPRVVLTVVAALLLIVLAAG